MASRGCGGSGGWVRRSGGFQAKADQKPIELFPDDVKLPEVKLDEIDTNTRKLVRDLFKYYTYYKASPYLLEDSSSKKRKSMHIGRFSDRKKTIFTRDSLSQVLMFDNFPKELVQGTSKQMPSRKKYRWNPESELKKLDMFEQKEKKMEGREDESENEKENEKKDGEEEEEEENAEDSDVEEESSEDDYKQNEYFDDDEDDYNDVDDDDIDDGPTY